MSGAIDKAGEGGWLDECDLVIASQPGHPTIRRLLSRLTESGDLPLGQRHMPFGLLIAPRPRWPLQHILLVLGGDPADQAALYWAARLAHQAGSAVTVLAVVPPVPAMYGRLASLDQGLSALLSRSTPLGDQMRWAAQGLVEYQIEASLKLRQGAPEWEIGKELARGHYDLVALAATSGPWWLRWLEENPISPLLRQASQPALITKTRVG
jgi:nucleotide-binding universal stress UspA family protein